MDGAEPTVTANDANSPNISRHTLSHILFVDFYMLVFKLFLLFCHSAIFLLDFSIKDYIVSLSSGLLERFNEMMQRAIRLSETENACDG